MWFKKEYLDPELADLYSGGDFRNDLFDWKRCVWVFWRSSVNFSEFLVGSGWTVVVLCELTDAWSNYQ